MNREDYNNVKNDWHRVMNDLDESFDEFDRAAKKQMESTKRLQKEIRKNNQTIESLVANQFDRVKDD